VSGKDRLVYIRLAFFVRIKCLRFSRNACVFLDFIILGKVQSPLTRPTPSFFKIKFYSKIYNSTMQIKADEEGTKINTEVNERVLKNIGTR